MKAVFSEPFAGSKDEISRIIRSFENNGKQVGKGDRNVIKVFDISGKSINIKAFKIPNIVNKIVYRYLRRSKAERSFNYAKHLLSLKIGTPQPIAFFEEISFLAFRKSYYLSEHLSYDYTFRELLQDSQIPNREEMIRAFTRFTFDLHEKEIEFLDHSPGNTLIRIKNGNYQFFLVDLNRMNFRKLSFDKRMENFSRLTSRKEIVKIMANEYSKYYHRPEREIFDKMWKYTSDFQKNFRRKHRMKQQLKFWRA